MIVSTLLFGYRWGKRDGWGEGYEQGKVDLPLLLREQSLKQGYCSLCNSPPYDPPSENRKFHELSVTNKVYDEKLSSTVQTVDESFYG